MRPCICGGLVEVAGCGAVEHIQRLGTLASVQSLNALHIRLDFPAVMQIYTRMSKYSPRYFLLRTHRCECAVMTPMTGVRVACAAMGIWANRNLLDKSGCGPETWNLGWYSVLFEHWLHSQFCMPMLNTRPSTCDGNALQFYLHK